MKYINKSDLQPISEYSGKPLSSKEELERFALQLRRDTIEITYYSGTGSSHVGGELSSADILAVLYGSVLELKPEQPDWPGRDIFIMSKGHCSAVLYAAMAWRGYFPREALWNEFNRVKGRLQEHCNTHLPGIEATTGSLGMGLSNACGYAWAARWNNGGKTPSNRVYCLLGDGECTEGQTWEAIGLGAQLKLDNLIAIVDYNKYIISSTTDEVMSLEPFEQRWQDFGWHVQRIDGHDICAIKDALDTARKLETAPGKPRVIICDTIKGKGISFMERDAFNWHAGHLDKALRDECLEELGGINL
jgi:transketolase